MSSSSTLSSTSETFVATPRGGPLPEPNLKRKFKLFVLQFISSIISNAFLILIVLYGLIKRSLNFLIISSIRSLITFSRLSNETKPFKILNINIPEDLTKLNQTRDWEDRKRWKSEKVSKDYKYYAEECGYRIIDQEVETKDGYLLKIWKVVLPHRPEQTTSESRRGGYPVLIQHGLFQSAGSFITSEERSLAFWLAEHGGYQVYLGNNRGIFNMGHRKYKRSDPRFWDFNIKELALYDLPAMVDHVLKDSGYSTLAFIGHSQGNATMFCSLAKGMIPSLGPKISCFIALAPAVYSGPLTRGFPFGLLKSMRWRTWRRFFGILDFLPIMSWCIDWLPSSIFGFLGYQMFAFLFNWTDRNWLLRRKTKMFRFTPSPVSSAAIFWWTGYQGFSTRGCVLDPKVETWWDEGFPPLAIYSGEKDLLVLTEPLLKRIETNEKSVKLLRHYELKNGEHCDHFWHVDAVELCFKLMIEDIESTRPRSDPEEERRAESRITKKRSDQKNNVNGESRTETNDDDNDSDEAQERVDKGRSSSTKVPEGSDLIQASSGSNVTSQRIGCTRDLLREEEDEEEDETDDLIDLRRDRDKNQVPVMDFDREVF